MFRGRNLLLVVLIASASAGAKRLALDSVGCVVQDSRGFFWLCTAEGLSCYDGHEFTNYKTADGLPGNWVYDFLQTRNGLYWVATSRGLCRLVEPRDSSAGSPE